MTYPDGKVETGHWKRDQLMRLDQDEEDYINLANLYVTGKQSKSVSGIDIAGPDEVRSCMPIMLIHEAFLFLEN